MVSAVIAGNGMTVLTPQLSEVTNEFLERLSPATQEIIRKDLIWKIRCFINYARIQQEEKSNTSYNNEQWGGW